MTSMNRPGTMGRNFRISDHLYDTAKAVAASRGETLTSVVTDALRRYIRRNLSDLPARDRP